MDRAPGMVSRQALEQRYADLLRERLSFEPRWRELASFIMPTAPRWVAADHNKGDRSKNKIVDPVATRALRIAKSGLLQGMASPARPWFELATPYEELNEIDSVARWLEESRDALLSVFARSNFYTTLGNLFEDELTFATAPMFVLEDAKRVMRFEVLPIGSYAIAQNTRGRVDVLCREITMSARQAASAFGREALPLEVQRALTIQNQPEQQVTVRHLIEPNPDYAEGGLGPVGMRYREVYWFHTRDQNAHQTGDAPVIWSSALDGGQNGGILQVGGYHECPFVVARWDKNDGDTYGTICPGIDALGDIKQLQTEKKAFSEALALEMQPPLEAGPGFQNKIFDRHPGAVNVNTGQAGGQTVTKAWDMRYPWAESHNSMDMLRQGIEEAFMKPLFLMLLSDSRAQPPTAEEVRMRRQEKVSILGPIHARHSDDVFDPLIDRAFGIAVRRSETAWAQGQDGLLPLPPEELQGVPLRAEYVSEIAQMLRAANLMNVEQHMAFAGQVAEVFPDALDSINIDALIEEHGEALGVPKAVRRSPEEIALIRQQRAEAQRAMAAAEAMPGIAKGVKDLSETNVGDQSALEAMAGA